MKPWLKNRNGKSAFVKMFSELLLTEKFQHYLRMNATSFYRSYIDFYTLITLSLTLIAAPEGGYIAPHIREIVCRKNFTIFKGCHYSRFFIMISSSLGKIETKNLNSDPRILIFLVLGTTSSAAH